ncbi:MAG TPA: peptidoglycan bridge formation glycyltransferase FemA/FemB family protein [Anaerolineae bacterium]|nr:peptidoglycan bridge formation glycyltransferase FemA/FemB family protein [Anaerolineae bacterium]
MDSKTWNGIIKELPGVHILQTWEWAEIKSKYGWEPDFRLWRDKEGKINAAAMILQRNFRITNPGPCLRVCYIPRGPLLDWENENLRKRVMDDLRSYAHEKKAISLKMDPELIIGSGIPGQESAMENEVGLRVREQIKEGGWQFSPEQIQFQNTFWIRLHVLEDELLMKMKQKTRYNIRLAERKGVKVRLANKRDLPLLYRMYAETAVRDNFIIRPEEYYLWVWNKFVGKNMAKVLIAEVDNEPVAGLFLFHFARKAWYLYGMSTVKHRQKMPNYLLQWEAIKLARSLGCEVYDLWGAPDEFKEDDSMWGVYRFKVGLGGTVIRTIGAWDYAESPFLYVAYHRLLPRILNFARSIRRKKIKREVG